MKTSEWLPCFAKEIEKRAVIGKGIGLAVLGGAANTAMGVVGFNDKAKENKHTMQLGSTRHIENQLQLPAAESSNFDGGKRIDNQALSAVNKF